jgi:hypothetical protein
MITDSALLVSGVLAGTATSSTITGQSITGAGAVMSTNTVDLSWTRDVGEGNDLLKCRVEVVTAFTGLTALQVDVIQADDAALSTNVKAIGSSGPIPVASLTAGARFEIELNARIGSIGQRYLGLRYTPTGTSTAGAVIGDFGAGYSDGQKFYPVGYLIL